MKNAKAWIPISLAVIITLSLLSFSWFSMRVDSGFATEVLLEYRYADKDISVKITDEDDVLSLKQILNGHTFVDSPACGFTTNVSVTMASDSKSIVFCPACDGCPLVLVSDIGRYIKISDAAREELDSILERYGAFFPCV